MVDRGPETKPEEQYPLLKVEGGGDMGAPQPANPTWGVACSSNKSWCFRWPELMSACWMTIILFVISFLLFYALGMSANRRQQFILVKCNSSRPGRHVFHHEIVPRGASALPFQQQAEWLAELAVLYPRLHFNVFYLLDDTITPHLRNRFINKLIPNYPSGYKFVCDSQQSLIDFERKYQNVNFTLMPLSMFMAATPLRFKWRSIPPAYLPFYARLSSVWEHGGVGVDLAGIRSDAMEASDSHRRSAGRRISAILKQHNDGINTEEYANALNKINEDEDTAIISMLFGFVNRFFNQTLSSLPAKSGRSEDGDGDNVQIGTITKRDVSNDIITKPEESNSFQVNNSNTISKVLPLNSSDNGMAANKSDEARVVLFYDFQILTDSFGPSYLKSGPLGDASAPASARQAEVARAPKHAGPPSSSYMLSIDADGTFVAASSRLHPILGHILCGGCRRLSPKLAIQEALLSQCSGLLRDDLYCNNIYVL